MTYGIDASALVKAHPTGVEKYARFLLSAMMEEPLREGESVVLYARDAQPAWLVLAPGWTWKILPFSLPQGWTHLRLAKELFEHSPDVFFSPAHEVPLATGKAKVVTTVHDIAYAKNRKLYSPFQNFRQRFAVRHALRVASRILAVSESTKRDLMNIFKALPEKITVTPLAPTLLEQPSAEVVQEVLSKHQLKQGEYFLYVGRIEEKKNAGTLIEAFIEFKKATGSLMKLVLVGGLGYGGEKIKAAAQSSAYAHDIRFLGYVDDTDIPSLYTGALAFVFPSHDEGFGLPVLEAMTMGTPVLLSDIPVFHEVAGSAAEYASPTDTQAFAEKLAELGQSGELRSSLVNRGLSQVEKYSWKNTARLTWEVLRSA